VPITRHLGKVLSGAISDDRPIIGLRVVVLVSNWWVPAPGRLCPSRRTRRISPVWFG
jgi:hypothetical protein